MKFSDPAYLKEGNHIQQKAYRELIEGKLLDRLAPFNPVLCGTIPIGVDIAGSDLDIICEAKDLDNFANYLEQVLGMERGFSVEHINTRGLDAVIAQFEGQDFVIEVFGQEIAVVAQNAYRHMLIEAQILAMEGEAFRRKIMDLKKSGYKTEPAFAKLLGLWGDPYVALLDFGTAHFGL